MSPEEPDGEALLDADVFISYIKADELIEHSERIITRITAGSLEARTSSMLYDDVVSALRSKGMEIPDVTRVILAIASIPHTPLPVTPAIALNALTTYEKHRGPRKLHYFDAYHVATAKINDLPMITSDRYIIQNQGALGITAIDLRTQ